MHLYQLSDFTECALFNSTPNNNINQNELLSKSSRRLCLLSFTSNDDIGRERFGEIRLFGTNYCDLYATIRLSCIVKVSSEKKILAL